MNWDFKLSRGGIPGTTGTASAIPLFLHSNNFSILWIVRLTYKPELL